jgi:hypothetical protein
MLQVGLDHVELVEVGEQRARGKAHGITTAEVRDGQTCRMLPAVGTGYSTGAAIADIENGQTC